MFCQHCGNQIEENDAFCPYCGESTGNEEAGYLSEQTDSQKNQKEKKNGVKYLIIGIIAAIFLAGGLTTVLFLKNAQETVKKERTEATKEKRNEERKKEDKKSVKEITEETERDKKNQEVVEEPVSIQNVSMDYVESVSATSELSEYNMTHTAERVIDGNLSTGWVEGVSGQGIGESIIIHFSDEYRINGFFIDAGFQQSDDLYYKNSRPSEIKIIFADGTYESFSLRDVNDSQVFQLTKSVVSDYVEVEIVSVYPGHKYEDTVISEISFY